MSAVNRVHEGVESDSMRRILQPKPPAFLARVARLIV